MKRRVFFLKLSDLADMSDLLALFKYFNIYEVLIDLSIKHRFINFCQGTYSSQQFEFDPCSNR